jgi:hypothetical protein
MEQFRLEIGRHFSDLIKENAAFVGEFKFSGLFANGAGECTALIAEQFRFQENPSTRIMLRSQQNRLTLTDCFYGLGPKRCIVIIRDGVCDNRERKLWHPRYSGNGEGSSDEAVGDDRGCRDPGLLDGDRVVQTAR